jgi:hypothetical protein
MSNEFTATRAALIESNRRWSPPEEVAKAIAAASEVERHLYIERKGETYRWSLAHGGGAYPLLRISARFLGVDYQSIYIGFRTLPDGYSILCEDPGDFDEPDAWTVLELEDQVSELEASELITGGLA